MLTTVVTTAIALIYVLTATKMYDAQSTLLVTPVSSADPTLATLGLITDSSDPTRPVETASKFVTNIDVAERVTAGHGQQRDAAVAALQDQRRADRPEQRRRCHRPADSPKLAKQLADAFAKQAVADRTQRLHERVDATAPLLRQQITRDPTQATGVGSLGAELALLQTLGNGPDPTIAVTRSPNSPPARSRRGQP